MRNMVVEYWCKGIMKKKRCKVCQKGGDKEEKVLLSLSAEPSQLSFLSIRIHRYSKARYRSSVTYTHDNRNAIFKLSSKLQGDSNKIVEEKWVKKHDDLISSTSWGEGAPLALVGHPSSDGVTRKMPYGVDVLCWPALHPIFSY